jgi:plasmid stabilization system protein ParE
VKVRVLAEAEVELRSAVLYYEQRQVGLGEDLYDRVSKAIYAIAGDPLRFPLYEDKQLTREFRRATVERFPYLLVYEVRDDEILIVAVAHSGRQPGYWDDRNMT